MRSDEAPVFLDIQRRAVRGLAWTHYDEATLEAWAAPLTEGEPRAALYRTPNVG